MIVKNYHEKTEGTEFIQLLKNSFKVGQRYTLKYIKEELTRIYGLVGVRPQKTITGQSLKEFFDTKPRKIRNSKALLIIEELI